jgi:hypothetical protein
MRTKKKKGHRKCWLSSLLAEAISFAFYNIQENWAFEKVDDSNWDSQKTNKEEREGLSSKKFF